MEKEQNIIKEKIEVLPEPIKMALENFDWVKAMNTVVKKHGLFLDQLDELHEICLETMLGNIDPDDFVYEIKDRLIVENTTAEKITTDLNNLVFEPINNLITENYKNNPETLEDENTIQNSITNPPASKPISFAEQKMNEPHSLQKNTSAVPIPPGEKYSDPYRENV